MTDPEALRQELEAGELIYTYISIISGEVVTWTRQAPDRWVCAVDGRECEDREAIKNILLSLYEAERLVAAARVATATEIAEAIEARREELRPSDVQRGANRWCAGLARKTAEKETNERRP